MRHLKTTQNMFYTINTNYACALQASTAVSPRYSASLVIITIIIRSKDNSTEKNRKMTYLD